MSRSSGVSTAAKVEQHGEVDDQEFLIQQDPAALIRELEGRQTAENGDSLPTRESSAWRFGASASLSQYLLDCSSSSSESDTDNDCRSRFIQGKENDEEEEEEEKELGWLHLARHVPLRRPKLYIASRTHTQLEQMRRDIQNTVFSKQYVQCRLPTVESVCSTAGAWTESHAPLAHPLLVLHMASRSQLCINQNLIQQLIGKHKDGASRSQHVFLSGASALLLNEACAEAIQYENSAEGRKARRRQVQQQAGLIASTTSLTASPAMLNDIEDIRCVGDGGAKLDRGCPYAIPSRLRAFLRYIQEKNDTSPTRVNPNAGPEVQKNVDQADDEHLVKTNPSPFSPTASGSVALSFSLEEMIAMGHSFGACPYLVSRLLLRGADVALLPYTYLVDEDQRDHLLGGGSTNPVTEEEEESLEVHLATACHGDVRTRVHPHHHVTSPAPIRRVPQGTTTATISTATAATLPPDYRGDYLVLDEAHNLAEQCLQTSTTEISTASLEFVSAILAYYLCRYQARLLASNKQRLRELVWWVEHVVLFLRGAEGKQNPSSVTTRGEEELLCCSFHDFLFTAGIDHVDVHVLRQFLQSSRLQHKLRGLVAVILAQHNKKVLSREKQMVDEYQPAKGARKAVKRSRDMTSGEEIPSDTRSALDTAALRVIGLVVIRSQEEHHPNVSPSSAKKEEEVHHTVDIVHTLRLVSSSIVDFYRLLRWSEYSDGDTRVLYSEKTLRLLQLEPGRHTLVPLMEQMNHTILAGGTMRPLPLSVYPLIPPVYRQCNEGMDAKPPVSSLARQPLGSVVFSGKGGWRLISEPHVVPPTSLQVWALGAGPSGVSWNFSQGALTSGLSQGLVSTVGQNSVSMSSSTRYALQYTAMERRVFQDLASALLNFSRVLPPEGVICFVPSYRFQYRFLRFLRDASPSVSSSAGEGCGVPLSRSYEAEIDAVKKIFSEVILEDDNDEVERGEEEYRAVALSASSAQQSRRGPKFPGFPFASSPGDDAAEATQEPQSTRGNSSSDRSQATIRKRHAGELMREYAMWIEARGDTPALSSLEKTPSSERCAVGSTRGALLFAVIGGKLSEGLNFSDHLGRAVLVVGLPYANPQESTTRSFLTHIASSSPVGAATSSETPKQMNNRNTDGNSSNNSPSTNPMLFQLYTDLCMRQVNQSIGRCIRHGGDYAVAILLDTRYTQRHLLCGGLSAWMQPSVRVAQNFGECFRGIRTFFQERKEKKVII